MSRPTRLPEWFIGGPRNGEDKLAVMGKGHSSGPVFMPVPAPVGLEEPEPEPDGPISVRYARERLFLGNQIFPVWVAQGVSEGEAVGLLIEILLEPHKVPA